jgi:hypothetical protein
MVDLDDFALTDDLDHEPVLPSSPPPGDGGGLAWTIAAVVVLVVVAAGAFWVFRRPAPKATPAPTAAAVMTPSPTATPSPPPPTPAVPLPSLDDSDSFVRDLATSLSSNPQFASWLEQSYLVRKFVAVVSNVAEGKSPRPHLLFLAPEGRFEVVSRHGVTVTAPQSYARYDGIADVVESVDPDAFAQVFATLLPLGQQAFRELGEPPDQLVQTVQRAVAEMLAVPADVSDPALVSFKVGPLVQYRYVDPKLEELSPAQKNLLRMGPRNVARIQAKLRALLAALDPLLTGSQGAGGD